MQVIFGLGNPGEKYQSTRHNAGFWFVDALAATHNATFKTEKKFKAEVATINHMGQKLWLVKPQTFMNCSGQSVIPFIKFYRIPIDQVLVAYDELDIPAGTAKLKRGGGHGGHNGLRDIIPGMGSEFKRLRIGIGHPGDKSKVTPWVLGRPSLNDAIEIERCIDKCVKEVDNLLKGDWDRAMKNIHTV
ncbi:aminoacyl-tRNA hydrolase [Marinicella sp. S1101]|uniref:aminoacyl-tRNA hydrolase n=1 Tax=Marinicella marina TaxID=2996016 RepID=UPI0022609537|nr:aminoacyl-tRNA hydrolase [Marinicella marina]MCX7552970.1 aminoacyl-tRNA hydrolase [Marinicella marina]MDJ1139720.1 aminoacyl-tRNA hydrolase [Marinicella marina]